MKKILTLMVMGIFVFSLMGTLVLAEKTNIDSNAKVDQVVSGVEIAPVEEVADSSGIFWNEFQRAFTFSKQKKAEISMKIADKRIIQVKESFQKGNFKKAEVAEKDHEKAIAEAEANIADLIKEGDEKSVEKSLARIILMQNRIETHNERALEIHTKILENKSSQMSKEQFSHLEEIFSNIQKQSDTSEARISQQEENLRARYKVLTGMSDEEIGAKMSTYDDFLNKQRNLRNVLVQQNQREMKQYSGQFNNVYGDVQDSMDNSRSNGLKNSGSNIVNVSKGDVGKKTGQIVLN